MPTTTPRPRETLEQRRARTRPAIEARVRLGIGHHIDALAATAAKYPELFAPFCARLRDLADTGDG